MTEKVNNEEFRAISWEEVQPGDVLMHDNGDRLTVKRVKKSGTENGYIPIRWIETVTAFQTGEGWKSDGFSPYRRVPDLSAVPTEPRAYHDKDGVLCVRQSDEVAGTEYVWCLPESVGSQIGEWKTPEQMADRAPFTPLVPMPSREAIHGALANALRGHGSTYGYGAQQASQSEIWGGAPTDTEIPF